MKEVILSGKEQINKWISLKVEEKVVTALYKV